jgi:hypothetical protein
MALASMTILLATLAFAWPVVAGATKIPFAGTWTEAEIAPGPEKGWEPGGRWQGRGWWLGTEFQTGDDRVDGDWEMLFDNHFDETGTGRWNGTVRGEVDCGGVWEGTFTGTCYGGWGYNGGIVYYRGHGSGCVEGMHISFVLENVVEFPGGVRTENRTVEGHIHDPHGD